MVSSSGAPNRTHVTLVPFGHGEREQIFDVPAPLHPLVGRQVQLAALCNRLSGPDVRLLTLTGPGGVGKTRLALEVAHTLAGRYERIHFIPLASVTDPALVLPAIARALAAGDEADGVSTRRIVTRIHDQSTLLVLDNVEQVVSAGAALVELLSASTFLDILVTSRELLHLDGEHEYELSCLALPEADTSMEEFLQSEAVALFMARVHRFDPDFELGQRGAEVVGDICRRLDGLPLAIELAAARIKVLSPEALRDRLTDHIDVLAGGPRNQLEHQRTMRGTVEWSYRLLSSREQSLLRWLSVFSGYFSLSAVESLTATAGFDNAAERIDLLHSLVDKSLVRRTHGRHGEFRFIMLMTIRTFARERARSAGEEEAQRDVHAAWCASFVEGLWSVPAASFIPLDVLQQVDDQFPDLQRALEWLESRGDWSASLRLVTMLTPYWTLRSLRSEGRAWLVRELAAPQSSSVSAGVWADALMAAAALARTQDDIANAVAWATRSLGLYRSLDDPLGEAAALNLLGVLARARGAFEEATSLCLQSWTIIENRGLHDPVWTALLQCNLGVIAFWQGRTREARSRLDRAIRIYRESNNEWGIAFSSQPLALVRCAQGDPRVAAGLIRESLKLSRDGHAKECQVDAIATTAVIAVACGMFEDAASLFGSIPSLLDGIAYTLEQPERQHYEAASDQALRSLGPDRFQESFEHGRNRSLATAGEQALALLHDITSMGAGAGAIATRTRDSTIGDVQFTPREYQVLALIVRRHTDKEIAETLFISSRTVSRHVSNIFDKLDVHSRREVIQLVVDRRSIPEHALGR